MQTHYDPSFIENIFSGNLNDALEIIEDYLADHTHTIHEFEEAARGNVADMAAVLHCHGAVFNYVGFPALYKDCKNLEMQLPGMPIDEAKQHFITIKRQVVECAAILEAEVKRLRN